MDSLKTKLKNLPQSPGVYLFKNNHGRVIYIGKAKNLRARVAQYFGRDERPQIPFLMADATDLDYTVVDSELDALFLENTLIKQYLPRYNIMLRDDKNFAFIKIDCSTQIPNIGYARKIDAVSKPQPLPNSPFGQIPQIGYARNLKYAKKISTDHLALSTKAKYFGPYSSAKKIRETLEFTRKLFPYCANTKVSSRPCFYYYLHKCPGVCIGQISLADYQKQINRIALFLSGKTGEIAKNLNREMQEAAKRKKFETAARLRDQLRALEILGERQNAIFPQKVNWDFISLATDGDTDCVNLFNVRAGKLIDKENFIYHAGVDILSGRTKQRPRQNISQTLQTFLENYYAEASSLPAAVFLQNPVPNRELVLKLLKKRASRKIPISQPRRGKKYQLIRLGRTNAQEYLRKWQNNSAQNLANLQSTLENLQKLLGLKTPPRRIEAYDISNLQGTEAVGSMVVFENGLPAKGQYRKFKIRGKSTPDDFAMMQEMLARRLSRLANSPVPPLKLRGGQGALWPRPDLIVIDGGKGQLGAALKAMQKFPSTNFQLPIIALAKRIEEIYLPNKKMPVVLPHSDPVLQLLQRLRDEAHRFAITFHRKLHSRRAQVSALDEIVGIGPKSKKLLKAKFGAIAQIRQAPLGQLTKIIGPSKAKLLKASL